MQGFLEAFVFSFSFILQVEGVNGVAMNKYNLYFKACCYCKWQFF
jgi:hypothetical protein